MNKSFNCLKIITALAIIASVSNCNKPDDITIETEGQVYMPQAIGSRGKLTIFTQNKPDSIVFGAARGGLTKGSGNVTVTFAVDAAAINNYNQKNGTAYRLMPQQLYSLTGLSSVIPDGSASSDPLFIVLHSKKALDSIRTGSKYILPIRLVSASSGPVDPANSITYFTLDTVLRKFSDVTKDGILTVSNENPGGPNAGEGSLKVVDNNLGTKYLFFGFTPNTAWMQLRFPTAVSVGAYTLTSGGDAPGRDPKTWRLMGSNDGTNWTDVDTRTNEAFLSRNLTRRFEVPGTPQAYTFYRFYIDQNNGDGLFQLTEWRMLRYDD